MSGLAITDILRLSDENKEIPFITDYVVIWLPSWYFCFALLGLLCFKVRFHVTLGKD